MAVRASIYLPTQFQQLSGDPVTKASWVLAAMACLILIFVSMGHDDRAARWRRHEPLLGRLPVRPEVVARERTGLLLKGPLIGGTVQLLAALLAAAGHAGWFGASVGVLAPYLLLGVSLGLGIAVSGLLYRLRNGLVCLLVLILSLGFCGVLAVQAEPAV